MNFFKFNLIKMYSNLMNSNVAVGNGHNVRLSIKSRKLNTEIYVSHSCAFSQNSLLIQFCTHFHFYE